MLATINDSRSDEIIAGTVVLTVGLIGNALNIAAVVLIYRTPSLHNDFGFICASHLLADIGLLTVFSFWAAPMLLFGFAESVTHSFIGERMGQLVSMFWYASMYGHFQIALNRLMAIQYPVRYRRIFSNRGTLKILMVFWLIPFLQVAIQFFDDCNITFHVDLFMWSYANTDCGYIFAVYVAFIHGATLCTIVVIINTISFFAILKEMKKLVRSLSEAEEASILRNNIRLYVQGCTQAACFVSAVLAFRFVPGRLTTRWSKFATLTIGWELVHAVDGLILIVFYEKFHALLRRPSSLWQKKNFFTSVTTM
ncbi:hypothetical protein V3C99_003779 [Haemonchus contortus]